MRTDLPDPARPPRGRTAAAALMAMLLSAGAAAANVAEVRVDRAYLPAGETARATAVMTLDDATPPGARLRITVLRDVNVPDKPGGPVGRQVETVVDRKLPNRPGPVEAPFELAAKGMLFGRIRAKVELLAGKDSPALAVAWSDAVEVGLRKRIDLAGPWRVVSMKIFDGEMPRRPKNWKAPPAPATVTVPGELPFDEGFRGWVTLKRSVSWATRGDLRRRAVQVFGASDSAAVRVGGEKVGETAPVNDLAVLTHWLEFHCRYKGPENLRKRYLLMADGDDRPSLMALPKLLGVEGTTEVEVTLRGTSGGIMGKDKRPYGVLGSMHLQLAPGVCIRSVSFDTAKPGPNRRLTFALRVANDTGKAFSGSLRSVFGRYEGRLPYSGPCPAFATADQPVALPPGESTVRVVRDETPRFDTCRATFLLLDGRGKPLDAAGQDYHTAVVEVRDRRDLYLNNERFLVKGQGSWGEDHNSRWQLRVKGGNAFRGHRSAVSPLVPAFRTEAANINDRYADGLLTSAGSALLASCEKCTFWDPKDPSNIHKAVRYITGRLAACPGILMWEATNELHGEPEAARVEILKAFHAADPYHRPVLATKGSGEWEAEARDGRVAGVNIVGCQYLLSAEATDSIVAAVTAQPIMSTEVNWNDGNLTGADNMYKTWLNKGLAGSLLFDYSGRALSQGVPLVPPNDREARGYLAGQSARLLYQDLVASAVRQPDGRATLTVGNQMPYAVRNLVLHVERIGRFRPRDLAPGEAVDVALPAGASPELRRPVGIRADYTTHGGLKHQVILTPTVEPAPAKGGAQ